MINSVATLQVEELNPLSVSTWVRNVSSGYLLLNAAVFTGLWTSQLVPLMRTREKIEFLYSIYILDLCFIMPAFVVVAVMAIRQQPFVFEQPMDVGALTMFGGLSGVFLILTTLYLAGMQTKHDSPVQEVP